MSRRKHLTFKKPDPKKVKLIGIIFVVCFIVFPGVRYNTGEALHLTANLIQSTAN
jgi:ATP/ADP translocase